MMDRVVSNHTLRFIIVVSAGVQVSIEPREVAARDLQTDPMASLKEVAGRHWLQGDLVDLPRLHPRQRFVVSVAIPHTLDRLVEVVSSAVRIDIDQLYGEVGVLDI